MAARAQHADCEGPALLSVPAWACAAHSDPILTFATPTPALSLNDFIPATPAPALPAQVHKVVEKADVVRDGWNGFNVLHDTASRVAALDIGFLPSARARASSSEPRHCAEQLHVWAHRVALALGASQPAWPAPLLAAVRTGPIVCHVAINSTLHNPHHPHITLTRRSRPQAGLPAGRRRLQRGGRAQGCVCHLPGGAQAG